jgi:chromosome segregation ATPase
MKFFEDMFSSHRGAGVIGTLVAVGVLAVLGTLFLLVFDQDFQGGEKSIEAVIRDQGTQIEQLSSTIRARTNQLGDIAKNKQIVENIDSVKRQIDAKNNRIDAAKQRIIVLQDAISRTQQQQSGYLVAYRKAERAQEIGKTYPELTTKAGRSYKSVVIKKIDDLRVNIGHEGGSGVIYWNDLPNDMMDRLQFNKELAEQQTKMEQGSAAQFAASAKESDIRESIAHVKEQISNATSAFESQKSLVSQSEAKIQDCQRQINQLRAMISREANKDGLRQTPRYRSQIEEHERTMEAERKRMADFQIIRQKYEQNLSEFQARLTELNQKLTESTK